MQFATLDAVFLTAGFLVPGFVWSGVLAMLVPRRSGGRDMRFIEIFTLSCLNNGFWSWAIFVIFKTRMIDEHPYLSGLSLFGIIFLSPVLLGFITGLGWQARWAGRFLRRLGLRTIDPAPAAWDWHFSRGKPSWTTVTLKNGSRVLGLYGMQSFAGDEPNARDLFLEATYRLLPNGEWAPIDDTAGALIMADQIALIEFRTVEVSHGEGENHSNP